MKKILTGLVLSLCFLVGCVAEGVDTDDLERNGIITTPELAPDAGPPAEDKGIITTPQLAPAPDYFLAYIHPDGSPGATTAPVPEAQLKSIILSLQSQGYTNFRVWEPVRVEVHEEFVILGRVL